MSEVGGSDVELHGSGACAEPDYRAAGTVTLVKLGKNSRDENADRGTIVAWSEYLRCISGLGEIFNEIVGHQLHYVLRFGCWIVGFASSGSTTKRTVSMQRSVANAALVRSDVGSVELKIFDVNRYCLIRISGNGGGRRSG